MLKKKESDAIEDLERSKRGLVIRTDGIKLYRLGDFGIFVNPEQYVIADGGK